MSLSVRLGKKIGIYIEIETSVFEMRVLALLWPGYVCMKTLESPLHSKKIKSVNQKGNQPLIFIGRTDVEAEAPIIWLPDAKS